MLCDFCKFDFHMIFEMKILFVTPPLQRRVSRTPRDTKRQRGRTRFEESPKSLCICMLSVWGMRKCGELALVTPQQIPRFMSRAGNNLISASRVTLRAPKTCGFFCPFRRRFFRRGVRESRRIKFGSPMRSAAHEFPNCLIAVRPLSTELTKKIQMRMKYMFVLNRRIQRVLVCLEL